VEKGKYSEKEEKYLLVQLKQGKSTEVSLKLHEPIILDNETLLHGMIKYYLHLLRIFNLSQA